MDPARRLGHGGPPTDRAGARGARVRRPAAPVSSASSSAVVDSPSRPSRGWPSSTSSRAGTTHAVAVPPWTTSHPFQPREGPPHCRRRVSGEHSTNQVNFIPSRIRRGRSVQPSTRLGPAQPRVEALSGPGAEDARPKSCQYPSDSRPPSRPGPQPAVMPSTARTTASAEREPQLFEPGGVGDIRFGVNLGPDETVRQGSASTACW